MRASGRREDAIVAFTDVIANDDLAAGLGGSVQRHLVARIIVAGVTDLVTSWLDGNLVADGATLIEAIVTVGRALDIAVPGTVKRSAKARNRLISTAN